jgi:hypothetical protein
MNPLARLRHALLGRRMELTAGQLAGTHCTACARPFRPDEMVEDYGRTRGRVLYTHPDGARPTAPRLLYSIDDPAIDAMLTRHDPTADLYELGLPGMAGTLRQANNGTAPTTTQARAADLAARQHSAIAKTAPGQARGQRATGRAGR